MATSLLLFAPSALAVSPPKREPAPAPLAKLTLEDLVAQANAYATTETRASSTRKAYLTDFRSFEGWCQEHGLASLPATPATVAVYLAALAGQGRRPSTLERALAGIAYAHRARGCPWPKSAPAIANVMKGIRRRHGTAPAQKAPLNDADIEAMVTVVGDDLVGRRDRALLTLGWMGAFRRSELVALRVEDVTRTREGLVLRVRRSKGDQEGRGAEKGIPWAAREAVCAVRALGGWLEASGIASGALFRAVDRYGRVHEDALSDRSVARIVQRVAAQAGFNPATVAGHSLRAGFATTAARKGKSLDAIMRQTLHRSERVARSYIRVGGVFENNAASGLL
jgi:site-specific recombinase XerD